MNLSKPIIAQLAEVSDGSLLKTFASLTHRMHDDPNDPGVRRQRDLVEEETLRRMSA